MSEQRVGRPTKYKPEYCQEILEFFNRKPFEPVFDANGNIALDKQGRPVMMPTALPTLAGFAIKLQTHRETVLNWTHKHPEFLDSYKRAKAMQEEILVQNGLAGNYEKAFAIFLAKNVTEMKDYKAIEVTAGQEAASTLSTTKKADAKWQIEFINSETDDNS